MNLDIRPMLEEFNAWQAGAARRHPDVTVSHYLSFQALRVTADYRMTEDNIFGVQWRGTPNSIQGNREGIRVPTLLLSATCAPHRVPRDRL